MADTSLEFDKQLLSVEQGVIPYYPTSKSSSHTYAYCWLLKFEDNYLFPVILDKENAFLVKEIENLQQVTDKIYKKYDSAAYNFGRPSATWRICWGEDNGDFMAWYIYDSDGNDYYFLTQTYIGGTHSAEALNWDFGHLVNGHASVHTSRYEFTLNKGTFTAKDTYTNTVVAIWKYKYTESEEPIVTPDEPEENIVTSDSSDCHGVALDNLQRQFGYTNLSDLIIKRASVWDKYFGQIAARFETEILSLDTCISNALDYYWGKLYKLSRSYTDANGNEVTLSDDLYREMLKIRAFGSRWNGTLGEMNEFLYNLFNGKKFITVTDSQSMSGGLKYEFSTLTDEELYLFANKDILPRQAGVGLEVHVIDVDTTFGFHGTELQPFNQGVFYQGSLV